MTTASFELRLTRFIRAAREKVYDAFVNAELLSAGHCPRGMTVQATANARGGKRHIVSGHHVELRRPEHLAYTWAWKGAARCPKACTR
ncbi:MAG: hypothetical protein IPH51_24005 [Rubrivivax sp.]|nr:hypothetical protein [Rubrivivax sp.]